MGHCKLLLLLLNIVTIFHNKSPDFFFGKKWQKYAKFRKGEKACKILQTLIYEQTRYKNSGARTI